MTDWPRGPVETHSARRGRARLVVRRGGKAVISLLSVTILALTWYAWQFIGDLNSGVTTTDVFDSEPQAAPLDGAIDILLVGQDSRTDNQGDPLPREVLDRLHAGEADGEKQTDTMILVHIPQDGTRAFAISFPRDSWVELAGGYGTHKLNSAYVYAYNDTFGNLTAEAEAAGEEADFEDITEQAKVAGRKNLIATIEQFIGKPGMIDRYAEVNLASFYEVTKALGGVEVCLKNPVKETSSGVNLKAGRQTLRGVQALAFVRQRYKLPNGDLDRIARQQAFLSGLVRKMLSPEVLLDPSKVSDVIGAVQKSVVLSQDWDLLEFAAQMRGLSGGNVEFHTIPVIGLANIGGADVVEVDRQEVQTFVDGLTEDEDSSASSTTSAPSIAAGAESFTVDVYNASGVPSVGDEVRELLRDKGFQGDGSATVDVAPGTVVQYHPGEREAYEAIAATLGGEAAGVTGEEDPDVAGGRLRVTVGSDYALPEGASGGGGQPSGGENDEGGDNEDTDEPITAGGVPCVN